MIPGRDGDALRAALERHGVPSATAARIVAEAAEPGCRLEPAPPDAAPPPRSRLGGPALLPRGEAWPRTDEGTPLAFLAALDLAELPLAAADPRWPGAGWLLFYGDLEDTSGTYGPDGNVPGAAQRVFALAPDAAAPVDAAPPDHLDAELRVPPQRVVGVLDLTLPEDYDAAERLGLDEGDAVAYEAAIDELHGADGDALALFERRQPELSPNWAGGLRAGEQGHPPEEGTVLLLHVEGHPVHDTLQFRLPAEDLPALDVRRAAASPEYG